MEFKHLETDINKLSIGHYSQILKSGNLKLLISDRKAFDNDFKLSFFDKINDIISSNRSFFGKILAFFRLMVGSYNLSEQYLKEAKYKYLEKAFDFIDTQIFELRGASSELIAKTNIKRQMIVLMDKVYNEKNLFASNRLRQLEQKLRQLEESSVTDYNVSKMCIIFTNELGFNFPINEFETSIVKFFEYSDILTERNKK